MLDTPRRVFVTGANGQDGSYLCEMLMDGGVEVHGLCRDQAQADELAVAHSPVIRHIGDLGDTDTIRGIIDDIEPDAVINLAGSTSVAMSWTEPVETLDVLTVGTARLLDACWRMNERTGLQTRFIQASSAEIFGDATTYPQTEHCPLAPVTPYGVAKAAAHQLVQVYRLRGMFAASAILYNHESPRRPTSFVARKITHTVALIAHGRANELTLGNIDIQRDWGFAPDYCRAMLAILHADSADDYIVATSEAHSVRDFVEAAFDHAGIGHWRDYVRIDPAFYRPADPKTLVGDSSKLRALGWAPTVDFRQLVATMVDADLALVEADAVDVERN